MGVHGLTIHIHTYLPFCRLLVVFPSSKKCSLCCAALLQLPFSPCRSFGCSGLVGLWNIFRTPSSTPNMTGAAVDTLMLSYLTFSETLVERRGDALLRSSFGLARSCECSAQLFYAAPSQVLLTTRFPAPNLTPPQISGNTYITYQLQNNTIK